MTDRTTEADAPGAVAFDNDEALLTDVLRCYKPHCRYLRSVSVTVAGGVTRGQGVLEIGESCYIDDTGHLNAVEVNICYNQLLYYVIAKSVRERLGPIFGSWTMADYWRHQLADILIVRYTSNFRWPIDRSQFFGQFEIAHSSRRRLKANGPALISLDTTFRFWDDNKGESGGEAKVAIVGS